jgi:hypothetical protein
MNKKQTKKKQKQRIRKLKYKVRQLKRLKVREKSQADGCSRCGRDPTDYEAFRCYNNTFKFNVDMARKFIADGREPVELDADDVRYSIDRADINKEHVEHVDPSLPGIIAHVFFPTKDGRVVHATRLIDGHHRAARCQQLNQTYRAFLLTERESVAILERCPDGARPAEYLDQQA